MAPSQSIVNLKYTLMISCQRERCSLKMIVEATCDQQKSKGFFVVKKVDSPSVIQNVTAQYRTVSPRSGTCQLVDGYEHHQCQLHQFYARRAEMQAVVGASWKCCRMLWLSYATGTRKKMAVFFTDSQSHSIKIRMKKLEALA